MDRFESLLKEWHAAHVSCINAEEMDKRYQSCLDMYHKIFASKQDCIALDMIDFISMLNSGGVVNAFEITVDSNRQDRMACAINLLKQKVGVDDYDKLLFYFMSPSNNEIRIEEISSFCDSMKNSNYTWGASMEDNSNLLRVSVMTQKGN